MKVVVLRGVSGSGKSTWTKENCPNAVICSADHFFVQEDGTYKFNPTQLGLAHRTCLRKFLLHCTDSNFSNDTLVVDNTNLSLAEVAPYVQVALAMGHEVQVIHLVCKLWEAANRNTHGVPFSTIENMLRRFESLPAYWNVPTTTITTFNHKE